LHPVFPPQQSHPQERSRRHLPLLLSHLAAASERKTCFVSGSNTLSLVFPRTLSHLSRLCQLSFFSCSLTSTVVSPPPSLPVPPQMPPAPSPSFRTLRCPPLAANHKTVSGGVGGASMVDRIDKQNHQLKRATLACVFVWSGMSRPNARDLLRAGRERPSTTVSSCAVLLLAERAAPFMPLVRSLLLSR
jgi:hypothetical protein